MPTQAKAAVIDEITERFQNSSAAVLTEYRGLTVAQLTQLRRSLGAGSSYAVVKNTLTKRAADSVGHTDLGPLLNGPTAIAFIEGDVVEAAKAIRDFARANPLLVVVPPTTAGRRTSACDRRSRIPGRPAQEDGSIDAAPRARRPSPRAPAPGRSSSPGPDRPLSYGARVVARQTRGGPCPRRRRPR